MATTFRTPAFYRVKTLLALFILFQCQGVCLAQGNPDAPAWEIGERIYRQGLDASDEPLQGRAEGDIEFKDAHFNCAQCHRRSGYGSSEGGNYVPPVTGAVLFNPRGFERADLFQKLFKERQSKIFWAKMRSANQRPAYDDASLARAIREGVDSAGGQLSGLMPRYNLGDAEIQGLIAYLRELSARNDPGVDGGTIYFATVAGKNADAEDKNAMLATIAKYVEWLNLETRGNQAHPNFSPSYRSDLAKGFRIWKHVVWELSDNPERWPRELADYYSRQPVFALIGGMAGGGWEPVHEFCEQNSLPELFPLTQLPAIGGPGHYTLYFNQGLVLEAKAMASYMRREKIRPALQIHAEDAEGEVPARSLNLALSADGAEAADDIAVWDIGKFRDDWRQYAASHPRLGTVAIWPGKQLPAIMREIGPALKNIEHVFLPSAAASADWRKLAGKNAGKLVFAYPYELPAVSNPHAFRVRAWMDTRKLPITRPAIQFNTYYALNMLQYGLEPIVDRFSRDYMLEYIEHEAENALNPGIFPRLSLGPEQRFASRGAYMVKFDGSKPPRLTPLGDWIIP